MSFLFIENWTVSCELKLVDNLEDKKEVTGCTKGLSLKQKCFAS